MTIKSCIDLKILHRDINPTMNHKNLLFFLLADSINRKKITQLHIANNLMTTLSTITELIIIILNASSHSSTRSFLL